MDFTFEEITNILNGKVLCSAPSKSFSVSKAVIDSRKVEQNDIFFAMTGDNVDGHDYIKSAIESKASLVVCEKDINESLIEYSRNYSTAIIKVDNCEAALQKIALSWRSKLKAKVIGITGSVGKTSSKQLCFDVLSANFNTFCNPGNLNNELGLPMTICSCDKDIQYLITEMGMSALGEIEQLCDIAKPNWGLITNIGTAHIEYLKTQENIAKAKSELAQALPKDSGVMFLNKSDKYFDFIVKYSKLIENNIKIVLYGQDHYSKEIDATQVWYENPILDDDGTWKFDLCVYDNQKNNTLKEECILKLQGKHNIINSCGAAAVGFIAGIKLEDIARAIGDSVPEKGRQELIKSDAGFMIINDAYNANPSSMIASIETLSTINCKGKKIAFLGDMFELGDYSIDGHISVGKQVAKCNIDYLFCVGLLSKFIADGATKNNMDSSCVFCFDNTQDAKEKLLSIINKDDVVLFKASNGMKFYDIVNKLVSKSEVIC